jgi:hypothetical protein
LRESLVLTALGPVAACAAEPSTGKPPSAKAQVFRAKRDAARVEGRTFAPAVLDEMLGALIVRLTNANAPAGGWKALFSAKDRVAIKVNTLGGPGLSSNPALVEAIVRGLVGAAVGESNILVWDRFNRELLRAGFKINSGGAGAKCYGTEGRYEPDMTVHGKVGGFLSPLLTQFPTALINVPVLKDHNLSGVAISMKNLYGTIDNPNRYHDNNCDPYIADMADLPVVKEKMRLIVCDALNAQYEAGPAYNAKYVWPANTILMATDPVALDATGWQMIEAKRREAGLKPLADVGRPPHWLATANGRGLGENDPKKIEVNEI